MFRLPFQRQATLSDDEAADKLMHEAYNFETALKAMDYVLDDRTSIGIDLLSNHKEIAIQKLALGVIQFLEATLGFEPETMKKANETLIEAESMCWKEKQNNEKWNLKTSSIYPPGTEYAVTYAEANLLNALLMLLSESAIESVKALYKLRRAYHTLDEITRSTEKLTGVSIEQDLVYLSASANGSTSSLSSAPSEKTTASGFAEVHLPLNPQQKKDEKLIKRYEKIYNMKLKRIEGSHIGNSPAKERLRNDLGYKESGNTTPELDREQTQQNHDHSVIDEFIHSGVNLCFGILQVVLSLVPPTIGKVLSVVGFKGSREMGLKMLWKASDQRNIHGGIGLLALLVFYDGPFQFTDVDFDVPTLTEKVDTPESPNVGRSLSLRKMNTETRAAIGAGQPTLLHPGKKLSTALLKARALFPNSGLWLLQEGRMLASAGRLEEAVDLMDALDKKIEMKQVEALLIFDRAMILCFLHRYERAAKDFIKLVDINAWSHGLYYYFAGACYLEAYRMCETKNIPKNGKDQVNPSKQEWYKEQASKYLLEAPELVGRRKFMAKTMPFDRFLIRKVKGIKEASAKYGTSSVDSVGTSLIHELNYFWNGYNRMPPEHLELALKMLGYSAKNNSPFSSNLGRTLPESKEESMIRYTLQSITLRRLGRINEGEKLLDVVIGNITGSDGKLLKLHHDPWLYPASLYEKALFVWKRESTGGLAQSRKWLKQAEDYSDDYELSTRIGMKIKSAIDRLEGL
ncbi:hypothetical protein PP7435_CHR1-0949 [Komagataella phaffii CBS 7435]|uniref:Mitochondrial outer membrane protein IML2 n=2 Tax=Komagataella phaffii TaxID=460519 RepID=C4QXN5_KOMPG|nr:uncharacterized protein PAS_chr1-4_0660 [Komagataella phaffii GS115]AOA61060.1 GQ67_02007T0 [Komagataella phaffii]CAH2446823.1 hypothetical protein BQ9382_C1-5005 [Komagataella phaffii CBS 7435]AOA65921.1 GQ68_02022T0 [Komagataella phaffii GS115]CAY68008.1 hypothetical protein PAS_chr1-4_0660 [Komagataella phaffii GS115]CCA37083.1 hypothetical protein PP7435_CHR1-0949 [Komagataella phaffii CBS 7435]